MTRDDELEPKLGKTHVRRFEVMRRIAGLVEREADGTWIIASDHLERAAAYERRQVRDTPVVIQTLSALPVERQIGADGSTWLDRQLVGD